MAVDLVIDIENTPGALAQVAAAISDAGVNIAAATCVGPGERAELHILVPHVEDSIDKRIPTPVITTSLFERFSSRGQNAFAAKVNAALRNQFGGHAVKAADPVAQAQPHAE